MNIYWNTCPEWKITKEELWKHEWEKHGTCIPGETIEHYFKHTLEAFLDAQYEHFYDCCNKKTQCLLHYSREYNKVKWLGYC